MTLVTIDAVVDVALHALVIWIGLSRRVAIRALEYRVVIRIGVARGADIVRVAVTGGELRVLRVIECGARPGSRVVAVLACGREELRLSRVARIGCVLVVRLVAADTRGGQRRVVIVDVAIAAHPRRDQMGTGERKRCVVVIKGGVCPDYGVVA